MASSDSHHICPKLNFGIFVLIGLLSYDCLNIFAPIGLKPFDCCCCIVALMFDCCDQDYLLMWIAVFGESLPMKFL